MHRLVCFWTGMALVLGALPAIAQTTGRVVGLVVDETNAIPLPGVPVEAQGTADIAYTDLDGRWELELPAGEQTLLVALGGYVERKVTVDIVPGAVSEVQVGLTTNVFAEEVAVIAPSLEAESSTASAQMMFRMRAPVVQDNIGAIEMRANNDSTAADSMARVTGVSVVDGGSVFVRGLGERYSNTTLNGTSMVTTQPDRRVVPLDLFPAGLIDSVQVSKTYTPDKPSQFAGGLVEIIPLKHPAQTTFQAGFGAGFNTLTTGQTGLGYAGGNREWFGRDNGSRSLPSSLPSRKVIRGGRFSEAAKIGFTRDQLELFGEQFTNVWDPVSEKLPLNSNFNFLYGGRHGKFGIVTTLRQGQASQLTNETQTFYKVGQGDAIERFNGPYDFNITERTGNLGGVGNVSFQANANHRVSFDNFFTQVGTNATRTFQGYNDDADNEIKNQRLWFVEERITTHHFGGDHLFPGVSNSRFDWKYAYSRGDRAEPDLREVLYEFDPARSDFVLADESRSGLRQFIDLLDASNQINANWSSVVSGVRGLPTQVKVGGSYIDRARDFNSRQFRFVPQRVSALDLSLPAEALFAPANIGDAFELKEETRGTDRYDATQETASVYGMVDVPMSARLRFVGGARIENFQQDVITLDPYARTIDQTTGTVTAASLDESNIFPATNFVYAVQGDQNIRFGYSRTVNRPEFREVSPFDFTDVIGGRTIVGNPNLKQSLIDNVDARWEWFPGSEEVVSASFFYKRFQDPIEATVRPTAQLQTSFTNAASANNVGLEVEARKSLGRFVFIGANYTYVDSEVTISTEQVNLQVQSTLSRPLAGTSKNLFNALFEVRGGSYSGRLLVNWFDDRINDVGSLGLPDIIEKARGTVDFVFSKRFNPVSLKFGIANLTDATYQFTQGTSSNAPTQRIFRLGRVVTFGLTFHP